LKREVLDLDGSDQLQKSLSRHLVN